MTEKQLPTIKLKGKDYVQVKDRVLFFNEEFPNGSIRTEADYTNAKTGYVWIKAIVIPDVTNMERYFIGRSAGLVDEEKSYEKLETVAVGRALALMGIGVLESIASADEIHSYEQRQPRQTPRPQINKVPYSNHDPKSVVSELDLPPCPNCKKGKFTLKTGKNGPFYSCNNYPACRTSMNMADAEEAALNTKAKAINNTFSDGAPLPSPEDLPF